MSVRSLLSIQKQTWISTYINTFIRIQYRFYQELDEVLELPALLVLDRIRLVVALEEVDRGEPLHDQALHIHLVRGVVHLCNDDLIVLCKLITELVPDRGCVISYRTILFGQMVH